VNADAVGFLGTREREREREHDEVRPFWLGEGEQRSSPKRENDGGASVLSTDARALRRLEEGGVREIRCQARPRNEKERRRESTAFDRKEKEEMGGGGRWSGVGGATQRKEGGGGWQPTLCGRATLAASRQRRVRVGVTVRGSRGMGRHVWAARERLGQPGEGRSWAGPERTLSILI
jgi:hypothetical protein